MSPTSFIDDRECLANHLEVCVKDFRFQKPGKKDFGACPENCGEAPADCEQCLQLAKDRPGCLGPHMDVCVGNFDFVRPNKKNKTGACPLDCADFDALR